MADALNPLRMLVLRDVIATEGWSLAAQQALPNLAPRVDLTVSVGIRNAVRKLLAELEGKTVAEDVVAPSAHDRLFWRLTRPQEQIFVKVLARWLAQEATRFPAPKQPLNVPLPVAMSLPELNKWSAKDPLRKLVRSFRLELLRREPELEHVLTWSYGRTYESLEDVLCPNKFSKPHDPLVVKHVLRLFELADKPGPALAEEDALRVAQEPPVNPELAVLRARLMTLWHASLAFAVRRPRPLVRQRTFALDPDEQTIVVEDHDFAQICPRHGYPVATRLQFSEDAVDVLPCAAHAAACPMLATSLEALIDTLDAGTSAKAFTQFAHAIAVPRWQLNLEKLDALFAKEDKAAQALPETTGWRLRLFHGAWDIEPVAIGVDRKGAKKVKKASLKELRNRPDGAIPPVDARVCALIRPQAHLNTGLHDQPSPMRQMGHILEQLCGHPHVVDQDDAPLTVELHKLELRLVPLTNGATWQLRMGDESLPIQLLARWQLDPGGLHFVLQKAARILVAPLTPNLRTLVDTLSSQPILPPGAVTALMSRLPTWTRLVAIDVPDTLRGQERTPNARPLLRLDALPDGRLTIRPLVRPLANGVAMAPGHGPPDVYGEEDGRPVWARRDLNAERHRWQDLRERLALPDEDGQQQLELAGEAALDCVAALAELPDAADVEWARTRRVTRSATRGDLRVAIVDKPDWFGVEGQLSVDGAQADLSAVLEAIRGGRRYVQVAGDVWLKLSDDIRRTLQRAADAVVATKDGLRLSPLQTDALDGVAQHLAVTETWRARVAGMRAAQALAPQVPIGLNASLRGYQIEGFCWLARLAAWSPGALLADDMGLGKTLQALALLLHRSALGPALVVVPTSVEFNWQREAAEFAPDLRVRAWRHGDRTALTATSGGDVLVVSYDLLVRDAAVLGKIRWATLVLDEAQSIKNATTHRWKAVAALHADFRVGLTGTPVENHIGELWALFAAIVPGLLGPWPLFQTRFGNAVERDRNPEAGAALGRLLRPFLLRRLKSEVARELPARTEIRVDIEPSEAERQLYADVRAASIQALEADSGLPPQQRRFQILAAITRLRQLACHPKLFDETSPLTSAKLEHVAQLLLELKEEGHRALVFSQFVRHLALVRARLLAEGLTCRYLDGATPEPLRRKEVAAFQNGEGDAFLISLKAGGTGLNLTAADYVIHLDPWWNPAVEDQATDRAHRIGQDKPVTVYRLVMRGSIEEKILDLHARKRDLVASLLAGSDDAGPLSADDLLSLLRV